MITEIEKDSIKELLEGSAPVLISDYLEAKAIRNNHGNPYAPNYIRDVLNGLRENIKLESHIWDAVVHYKNKYERRDKKRRQLLKKTA